MSKYLFYSCLSNDKIHEDYYATKPTKYQVNRKRIIFLSFYLQKK